MSRNWLFTIFENEEETHWPSDPEANFYFQLFKPEEMTFMLFQMEKCPSTGKLHLQGYLQMKKKSRMNRVKSFLPRGTHLENMRGTVQEAIAYCSKEETRIAGPWNYGTRPTTQGQRSDLLQVCEEIKRGATKRKIAEEFPEMVIKYSRGIDNLRYAVSESPRWRTLQVWWVWGKTGTGKTRLAMDSVQKVEDIFIVHSDGTWWDGYDNQDTILFDDFYGQIKCEKMLRYLDGHPLQLPIKGSFVYARYTKVWITSNVHYSDIYKNVPQDVKDAFERRITEIITK